MRIRGRALYLIGGDSSDTAAATNSPPNTRFIFRSPALPRCLAPANEQTAIQPQLRGHSDLRYYLTGRSEGARIVRSRRAFTITDTELRLMAAAAMIGLSRMPKNG